MKAKLYIVSTPIGNLKDITLRAIEILKEVDFIACEDTRVTSKLLNRYNKKVELTSLNAVNENKKAVKICDRILKGENCALVSDAGTPSITDPGVRFTSLAIKKNIIVIPIPGVTALITALSISGLRTDSVVFEGFLPKKKGRQKKLKQFADEERTIIIYESTYRIGKLLNELNEYMPSRTIAVCRELTKKFEEVWRGKPGEILESLNEKVTKGEFVVVISPKNWKVK